MTTTIKFVQLLLNYFSRQSKDVVELEEVKELINKYPHMDVVEGDKLEWMGEMDQLPPPAPDKPYHARFDFDGKLAEIVLVLPNVVEMINEIRDGLQSSENWILFSLKKSLH